MFETVLLIELFRTWHNWRNFLPYMFNSNDRLLLRFEEFNGNGRFSKNLSKCYASYLCLKYSRRKKNYRKLHNKS